MLPEEGDSSLHSAHSNKQIKNQHEILSLNGIQSFYLAFDFSVTYFKVISDTLSSSVCTFPVSEQKKKDSQAEVRLTLALPCG